MFDNLTGTLQGLSSTGTYLNQLVGTVQPTVSFLYDNVLTNPIFYGLVIVLLILSVFRYD